MSMVRDSHRPAKHDAFGRSIAAGDLVDFVLRQTTFQNNFVPGYACESGFELRPALAVVVEKGLIVRFQLDDAFGNAREHCEVTTDVRLDVQCGDLAAE